MTQIASYSQVHDIEHEVGIMVGAGHYFGDLNPNLDFQKPGPSGSVFWRMNLNDRFALRTSIGYMNVAYKDEYSSFVLNKQRNLSFKSSIFDIHSQMEFNFLNFVKNVFYNEQGWRYSPYISMGAGVFFFNPQAEYNGKIYNLQAIGTEGQNDPSYSKNQRYNLYSWSINYGLGFKYHIARNVSCGFDFNIHRTFTDYLDDVSGVYVPLISLEGEDKGIAYQLYDRSKELGPAVGAPGRQRGSKLGSDDFATFMINFSWTFLKPYCPREGTYN